MGLPAPQKKLHLQWASARCSRICMDFGEVLLQFLQQNPVGPSGCWRPSGNIWQGRLRGSTNQNDWWNELSSGNGCVSLLSRVTFLLLCHSHHIGLPEALATAVGSPKRCPPVPRPHVPPEGLHISFPGARPLAAFWDLSCSCLDIETKGIAK